MAGYDTDWSDDQQGVYDDCYRAGQQWAVDNDADPEEVRRMVELANAAPDTLDNSELDIAPLSDAVAEVTGEVVTTVTVDASDPAFRGFVDGVRDAAEDDVFGA
ncbi:hypothetical protein [Melissospora conviva]|uniref:hypothetical protein n=1 Tax=Melissospora conviva TaxID=3388432 RepID=UPI003C1CAFEA